MAEEFDPEPNVYLAVTVPKFPNYFVVNGVRGKSHPFQSFSAKFPNCHRKLGSRHRASFSKPATFGAILNYALLIII